FIRDGLARPYRPRRFAQALSQALRLSYMVVFSIPLLVPALIRAFGARLIRRSLVLRDGIEPARLRHSDNFAAEAAASMKVYPANVFRSAAHVRPHHYVGVPVQVIVNTRDPYVRPYSYDDTSRWVPLLWRRDIRAGHWSPLSHPAVLAGAVAEMVDVVEGRPPSRAMRRARVGRRRKPFADTLVSVTGAGSGIGRATALEFARLGAEVVVSDIDEVSVRSTVADIAALGEIAHAYGLDVSDGDAVEAFADEISREHGVPDIVVNNAGIGQAGRFLDTPAEQWERVLDVNLGGVVHGCRAFASRLVDRGLGGHIVNVASMAAYIPVQSLNAYCTSKAAVYMFSDCLRAELDAAGIGLTTVCPGLINTNILAATRFDAPTSRVDLVDGRRRQLQKLFAARGYPPEKVAKAIVSAVQKNKPIRPVTAEAYLVYGTARVLPQVLRSTARGKVM
ncbi:MAG TPA: SDR family oxidoreductase, partial [Mycobacterium sp.]|nr:SDR family oxidoreductase [Mycobacterium sp.]